VLSGCTTQTALPRRIPALNFVDKTILGMTDPWSSFWDQQDVNCFYSLAQMILWAIWICNGYYTLHITVTD